MAEAGHLHRTVEAEVRPSGPGIPAKKGAGKEKQDMVKIATWLPTRRRHRCELRSSRPQHLGEPPKQSCLGGDATLIHS